MNKSFGMLLVLVLVPCILAIPHVQAAPKGPGDVNGDGKVDIQDIVLATDFVPVNR